MKVLEIEKKVGIETFFASFKGLGGKLRTYPQDFIVKEISTYPKEKKDGKFALAEVTSINWETNQLARELSNRLHISRQRIGFAGTKDKRAKTTQLMSFYNVSLKKLSEIKIEDVVIENAYRSDKPAKIGNLKGNNFEVIIRNINSPINKEELNNAIYSINNVGGFPNFFGIQRFGAIRPITHIVGKYIVKDDFEKAVMTYVANPIKEEGEDVFNLREKLQESHDFAEALKSYPNKLNYEKAILNKLVQDPKDFVSALKQLPKNLLTMFVYAYQSYLFNKILSERIKKNLPLNQAIVGDIILPVRKEIIDENGILVNENNIDKVNFQISKGRAFVSGVLFGSDSIYSEGEMSEIEHNIIEKEKIDPRDFIIPDISYISSTGTRRPLLAPVKDLKYKLIDDENNSKNQALVLKFMLKKGCYATSLLREFMKSNDIRNY
jgi:tRNA pseudouridine13 synthase